MCDPVSLAVASAGMNILSAQQQHQAQKAQYESNKQMALQAQADELRQINVQEAQEDTKAANEKLDNNLAVREQIARAEVAGGDSGALLNNNAVIQDMQRQGLVADTRVGQNLDNTIQGLQEERLGSKTKAQSRINSVARPSSTATGLLIGQAVVGGMKDSGKFT